MSKKLFFILTLVFLLLSYWLVPILLNNQYHMVSFWDPIWKFNSYGWYEAARQFLQGEIFDWGRWPIVSGLVIIGFFAILNNPKIFSFALLFAFWFLMYFGRTTWGGLIDIIPGMKDFHQHRFIVGIHAAAIFLIPAGLSFIFDILRWLNTLILKAGDASRGAPEKGPRLVRWWKGSGADERQDPRIIIFQNIIFYILSFTFISFLAYKTLLQTITYTKPNNEWISQANFAYRFEEKNFQELVDYLNTLPPGRVYAGRPGNWGKSFRLGSTQMYMMMGISNFDVSQFLPETWSPLSENEQNFDERSQKDYDLLNIRYVVSDANHDFPISAKLEKAFGPFQLYRLPTSGFFDVVSSPMFVKSDKTNFINLVHLWHRSYPRLWKMHPLISVEKNPTIPAGMQKIIEMTDEVTYKVSKRGEGLHEEMSSLDPRLTGAYPESRAESRDAGTLAFEDSLSRNPTSALTNKPVNYNIFNDFPFIFPESTPSAKISNEKISKQTYSTTVEVPNNCQNCYVMFKMSYHPNWIATVDGNRAEKFAVFPFYLALPLSPGTHTVEFTYKPNQLKIILLISETLLIAIIIFLKLNKK